MTRVAWIGISLLQLAVTSGMHGSVRAQTAPTVTEDFQAALWAASCMACHGTDGRAEGTGLTLASRPAGELLAALLAFQKGSRRATVMHQHVKGYSEDELIRIARQFARVR